MGRYTYSIEQLEQAVLNSRSIAQTIIRLGLIGCGGAYASIHKNIQRNNIDVSHFTGRFWNKGKKCPKNPIHSLDDILSGKVPHYPSYTLKRRLIAANIFDHKCYTCGLTEWNGVPIPIELDHINGIHSDNRLENLTILCPNCHSLTPTHAGKNSRTNPIKIKQIKPIKIVKHTVTVAEYHQNVRANNDIKNKHKIELMLNSDIDFSKFGWVQLAAKLLEIKPQVVNRWMKRNMPEFYTKCFVRSKDGASDGIRTHMA